MKAWQRWVGTLVAVGSGFWLAGCDGGGDSGSAKPDFQAYDQAVQYYSSTYTGEALDPGPSKAVSKATYYAESGEGVMTLQFSKTPEKTYIFRSVPAGVWAEFKAASNKGGYYNTNIAHRYTFNLNP